MSDKTPLTVHATDEELDILDGARDALHDAGEAIRLPSIAGALDIACRAVAELRALRRPVDVDAESGRLAGELRAIAMRWAGEVEFAKAIRPHVEHVARLQRQAAILAGRARANYDACEVAREECARLAREAEGLRKELAITRQATHANNEAHDVVEHDLRAEVERLKSVITEWESGKRTREPEIEDVYF